MFFTFGVFIFKCELSDIIDVEYFSKIFGGALHDHSFLNKNHRLFYGEN